jgi:hypothetical protein
MNLSKMITGLEENRKLFDKITLISCCCCAAALTFAFILIFKPYLYGSEDHVIVISYLKKYLDPSLYPHDLAVSLMPHYDNFFLPFLALIIKKTGIEIPLIFFVLHVISLFFTFLGAGHLSKQLFNNPLVGPITMFFFLIPPQNMSIGGVALTSELFLLRGLVLPLILYAIYFQIKNKFSLALGLLLVAFNLHPISGLYGISIMTVLILWQHHKTSWKLGVGQIFLIFLITLPVVIKYFYSSSNLSAADAASWLEFVHLRFSHHLFLPGLGNKALLVGGLLLVFILVALNEIDTPKNRSQFILICSSVFLFCLVGLLFSYFWPISAVIKIQPLRFFSWFNLLGIMLFSQVLSKQLVSPLMPRYLLKIALFIFIIFLNNKFYPWAVFFCLLLFTARFFIFSSKKLNPELCLHLSCLAASLLLVLVSVPHLKNFKVDPAASSSWRDVQLKALQLSDKGDIFITPPGHNGFRLYSERSIYTDWKDGTVVIFNQATAAEWLRRMINLGYKKELNSWNQIFLDINNSFQTLPDSDLEKIAKEIKSLKVTPYLVMPLDARPRNFPILYRNKGYVLYKIP